MFFTIGIWCWLLFGAQNFLPESPKSRSNFMNENSLIILYILMRWSDSLSSRIWFFVRMFHLSEREPHRSPNFKDAPVWLGILSEFFDRPRLWRQLAHSRTDTYGCHDKETAYGVIFIDAYKQQLGSRPVWPISVWCLYSSVIVET